MQKVRSMQKVIVANTIPNQSFFTSVWELHYILHVNKIGVRTLVNKHFRWNYDPKYYKVYNIYDTDEKVFTKFN